MNNKHQKMPYKGPDETPITVSEPVKIREVKPHLRCPSCWGGLNGRGIQYGHVHHGGEHAKLYLRCDCCGHTWAVTIRTDVVAIDHRLPDGIKER